jgi:hypothetical protein
MLVGSTYMSWWPDESAGPGRDYNPIRNKSFTSDVRDEGGPPDFDIALDGLNEQAMLDWWSGFGLVSNGVELQGPMRPYNLVNQNCSTVVASGLSAGGGE